MAYQLPIQKPAPQQIPVASALPALDVSNSAPAQPEEDLGQLGFSAFVDSQIGAAGFKASTSDGKSGFIIQSGPYKGKSKEQAMEALRAQYVAFPPDQKQRWEARGTGRDLNSQPPGAGKPMQGQGKAPMNYSMSGSAPSFSGLDWLRANRKTGDELAQAESNVAWTKGFLLGIFAAIPLSFTTLLLGAGYKLIQLIVGGDKIWLTGLLTTNWAKLEGMLRNKAKSLGMNGGQATMEDVINFLGTHHAITPSDVSELHHLRMDRNAIAHVGQSNNLWSSARRSESILRKYQKRF